MQSSVHISKSTESAIGLIHSKIDTLLETSRTFMIGDRTFSFDENESIFFLEKQIDSTQYHNTPNGCNTCNEKWKKATDLHNSHCQFCGMSSCKKCLKKTRQFRQPRRSTSLPDERERKKNKAKKVKRGIICKLCDRKFIVKQMVQGSLDSITMQN